VMSSCSSRAIDRAASSSAVTKAMLRRRSSASRSPRAASAIVYYCNTPVRDLDLSKGTSSIIRLDASHSLQH
jgi:hypothetical protein